MPNKNYQRGRRLEWQVCKDLEAEGYHAVRTAGSHGAYDVVAMKDIGSNLILKFIQCKVTKNVTTVKKLTTAFRKNSPIKMPWNDGKVKIDLELIVKVTGEGGYRTYPIGA